MEFHGDDRLTTRIQLHSAFRTFSRRLADHVWVHGTRVFGSCVGRIGAGRRGKRFLLFLSGRAGNEKNHNYQPSHALKLLIWRVAGRSFEGIPFTLIPGMTAQTSLHTNRLHEEHSVVDHDVIFEP